MIPDDAVEAWKGKPVRQEFGEFKEPEVIAWYGTGGKEYPLYKKDVEK